MSIKITLPNGIVVESDEAVSIDGTVIGAIPAAAPGPAPEPETAEEPTRPGAPEIVSLGRRMFDTLKLMREYDEPLSLSFLADSLSITNAAAGQRMTALVKAGVVERTGFGIYRAINSED